MLFGWALHGAEGFGYLAALVLSFVVAIGYYRRLERQGKA